MPRPVFLNRLYADRQRSVSIFLSIRQVNSNIISQLIRNWAFYYNPPGQGFSTFFAHGPLKQGWATFLTAKIRATLIGRAKKRSSEFDSKTETNSQLFFFSKNTISKNQFGGFRTWF